jgi:biopolymer transport protein TolR
MSVQFDSGRKDYHLLADINVTNLVDVVLVLLIIFMIAAPMLQSGIELNLPKAVSEAKDASQGTVISITGKKAIFINDQFVSLQKFEGRLAGLKRAGKTKTVFLRADKDVPYGVVVNIMGRIRGLGIDAIDLATEPEKLK